MKPFRVPLYDFPDLVLHADEMAVKRHPQYSAAKTGDADAAEVLVAHLASRSCVPNVAALLRGQAVRLLPVHALESEGVNEIPVALADLLANLIGYVESKGGHAVAATVLTGKPHSAKLAPDDALIEALRDKHGRDLEDWWRERFGFGFDCLTRSEARYLENSPDAQAVRDRLIAAGPEGSSGPAEGSQGPIGPADGG